MNSNYIQLKYEVFLEHLCNREISLRAAFKKFSKGEKKINGKRVRRPSTSQKCHPASLAFWRSSLWERNPLDAKDAYRRVGHIDKFNAVASAGRVLAVPVSDPGRSLELSTHLLKTLGKIIGAEASSLFGPRTLDQGLRSRRAKRSLRK